MKAAAPLAALALLAACAGGGPLGAGPGPGPEPGQGRGGGPRGTANPSAVIAAEIAFAQAARDKGQWTAFRETAAPGAEMFVPRRVLAADWLKDRADPAAAVRWQAHEVWMSCDGSHAISTGAWQREDGFGEFLTLWQRQPKSGQYKWLIDHGSDTAQPVEPPEMIAGRIADCTPGAGPVPASPPPAGTDAKVGSSPDRTLQWSSWVRPDQTRQFFVWAWNGKAFDQVLNLVVTPPAAPGP